MIEPESENDESQSDEESHSEKFDGQLCTFTQSNTPLHAVSGRLMKFQVELMTSLHKHV